MAPHYPAVKLQSRAAAPSAMGAHRLSHAVAKTAPLRKIRIVHVLAPEVIKTDVRQFRELVQRLTGKPNGGEVEGTPSSSSSESAAETSQPAWSADAASAVVHATAGGGATAAVVSVNTTIKTEVKETKAVASPVMSGEEEIPDVIDDVFFQELEDFLFSSSCHMDGWL